ncbi:SDR family NAD(P)-dependent oxidoreductase [Enterobacter hormaechei]|uniref:SDR family NAD(P)-dependent oxidoreductase n=1 Tax=Enterobacter hormaechei TaxID=158836 RepID=UPI003967C588
MNISLKNKVALVTGAASGIGFATARAYAEAGAAVVLADINSELVDKAANDLISRGFEAKEGANKSLI